VDSVEIYQPDDHRDTESGMGDGHVYNLEVEEFHTYIANEVVVHNCHHLLRENKWGKAIESFTNARGLGVTATPHRADGKGLGRHAKGVFDCIVEGPSMRDLIDDGYLTDYRIYAPPSDFKVDEVAVSQATGDFIPKQLAEAAHQSHIVGDVVQHYKRLAMGKTGVTFATDVESATHMAQEYCDQGVPAQVVSANTDNRVRQDATSKLRNRELLQLVNVDIFGEGFDLPAIEVVSMARPTKSYGLYAQQFGRGLRILEGKKEALIIDHVSNVVRHGLPDAAKVWTLDSTKGDPSSKREEDDIPLRYCVECTQPVPRTLRECPYCGHYHEPEVRSGPEHVDGDLLELTPDVLARMRREIEIENPASVERRMRLARAPEMAVLGAMKRLRLKQEALGELREALAWWGGYHRDIHSRDDSESYRLFYHLFGVDVLTAQTGTAAEMLEMAARINTYLENKDAHRTYPSMGENLRHQA